MCFSVDFYFLIDSFNRKIPKSYKILCFLNQNDTDYFGATQIITL